MKDIAKGKYAESENLKKHLYVCPGWRNSSSRRNRGTQRIKEVTGRGYGQNIKCSRGPSMGTMRSGKTLQSSCCSFQFGKPVQLLFHSHRVKGRKRDDKRLRSDQIITKIECILQIKGKNRMETEGECKVKCFYCLLL